ncbi:MAG: hypothetical protein ACI9J3_000681 [Parvicellaceae bacterium]|jgi:hypothetical protein
MEDIYADPAIRNILIELAVKNKTTTYARLNAELYTGYDFRDAADRDSFNEDVEAISIVEVKNGRPPLSSVVVYKSGSSSKHVLESLYDICEELYGLSPETTKPNSKFLKSMQAKCHEYWTVSGNYNQFGPIKR